MVDHVSVMLHEAIAGLVTNPNGFYIDGTFGQGGHSKAILDRLSPKGQLFAIDRDPKAVLFGKTHFAKKDDPRFSIEQGSFDEIGVFVDRLGKLGLVDGILLDLGLSSSQLEESSRGFSFLGDGPLDMRINQEEGESAAKWLNRADEHEIAEVLSVYGEERFARKIANKICRERKIQPIATTRELVKLIESVLPYRERNKHPATRSFLGIRIFINRELEVLKKGLAQSVDCLKKGGRLVVISFHSLEDRIVKRFIRSCEKDDSLINPMLKSSGFKQSLRKIGKKAFLPTRQEKMDNARARSAVLRIAEKVV